MRHREEGLNSRRARERSERRGNEFMSSSKERAGRSAGERGAGIRQDRGSGDGERCSWLSAVC